MSGKPGSRQVLKILGKTIRERRIYLGITQKELAKRSETPETYMSDIEQGDKNVSFIAVVQIAQGLDERPAEFFKRFGENFDSGEI